LRFIDYDVKTTVISDREDGLETYTVDLDNISDFVEENDAAMLVVGLTSNKKILFFLNKFRELRVPYLFVKQGQIAEFDNVAVPMTYLEEDKEKGPFAGAFGRFFSSKLIVYKPKDYGSKAQRNIEAICGLFDTLNVEYEIIQGRKDSTKIELEAVNAAENSKVGLVIVSASREYGLDDLIFGPKERKIIMSASVPVMLINPRGDLYALCD
jgi:nucleotide-binding universal stress UspA family protein